MACSRKSLLALLATLILSVAAGVVYFMEAGSSFGFGEWGNSSSLRGSNTTETIDDAPAPAGETEAKPEDIPKAGSLTEPEDLSEMYPEDAPLSHNGDGEGMDPEDVPIPEQLDEEGGVDPEIAPEDVPVAIHDDVAAAANFSDSVGDVNQTKIEDEGEIFITGNEEFTAAPTLDATEHPVWYYHDWAEMPETIQEAAEVLGFTQETWDFDENKKIDSKRWSDLNRKEKDAARKVGWTRWSWNVEEFDASTLNPTSSGTTYPYAWAPTMWDDLPEDVRSAAEYLGYNEEMWDDAEFLPLLKTKWEKLSGAQRSAALEIGYDEQNWNDSTR